MAAVVRERMTAARLIRYVHADRCFVLTDAGRGWLERWRLSQAADSGYTCPDCGRALEAKHLVTTLDGGVLDESSFFVCHNPDCERVRIAPDLAVQVIEDPQP